MISPKRTRILIAENDDTFGQALSNYLRQENREISLELDGREAIEILNENSPADIIVTELSLPGVDGLSLVKR